MKDCRIPKDLLCGELAKVLERGRLGDPQLCFKDICERDLKALAINTDTWEALECDRCAWRQSVQKGLSFV